MAHNKRRSGGTVSVALVYRLWRRVARVSDFDETNRATRGALILCGGGSRRMGRDKASLPFGDETMLARVMRMVAEVVPREQIVLAAAAEQELPPLPWNATVLRDRVADRGPLPALSDGLAALPPHVSVALVVACDSPLIRRAFIEAMFFAIEPASDAAVPGDGQRLYPLTAVYRPSCVSVLQAYRDDGGASLQGALRSSGFRLQELPLERLRAVDSELQSLLNCNTSEEYEAALMILQEQESRFQHLPIRPQ